MEENTVTQRLCWENVVVGQKAAATFLPFFVVTETRWNFCLVKCSHHYFLWLQSHTQKSVQVMFGEQILI